MSIQTVDLQLDDTADVDPRLLNPRLHRGLLCHVTASTVDSFPLRGTGDGQSEAKKRTDSDDAKAPSPSVFVCVVVSCW